MSETTRTQAGGPRVPAGTLVYAIGDVHGCPGLLDKLLARIAADAEGFGAERRVLVFVGDYVDRGPDSAGVIERVAAGLPAGFEAICLKGNHEDLMLDFLARADSQALALWLYNGGDATLASYGVKAAFPAGPGEAAACRDALLAALPEHHRTFLDRLRLSATLGDYFFAHAGVMPGVPLDQQQPHDLMWVREPFLESREDFGKVVVHGHTPVERPDVRENRIGIDTGAFATGRLTALRLHGDARAFLEASP